MNYHETGFRALYRQFAAFNLDDKYKKALSDFPNADKSNCMLVYGYIDREAGMTLEVVAAGIRTNENYRFFESSAKNRFLRCQKNESHGFCLGSRFLFANEYRQVQISRNKRSTLAPQLLQNPEGGGQYGEAYISYACVSYHRFLQACDRRALYGTRVSSVV